MPQYSVAINNAKLDVIESTIGASPKLRMYTGAVPANCAAVATGTMLVEIPLPADWLSTSSANSKIKVGTWTAAAVAGGVVGYYRIVDNAGAVAHVQGAVGMSGSGAEAIMDNTTLVLNQTVTINAATLVGGNT